MALTYKQKFNKKYGFAKDKAHSLRDIARITGRSYKGIKQIFEKGEGAYYSNPQSVRKNVKSPQQWAYARVYSAVMGGKAAKVDKKELGTKTKKMAVKYSKTRDFGAKNRKQKKLGNKMFTLHGLYRLKAQAKLKAKIIRSEGKMARVVKMTKMGKVVYGVYKHGRGGRVKQTTAPDYNKYKKAMDKFFKAQKRGDKAEMKKQSKIINKITNDFSRGR